jgi:3',5'-cyclic AMP phosphodiesterase CpdA
MNILARHRYRNRDGALQKEELDYPERLTKSPDTTRIGHLSDFHLGLPIQKGSWDGEEVVDRWLQKLDKLDIDVLVVSGDLVERPGDREWLSAINQKLMDYPVPFVVVPGNHDILKPGGQNPFEEHFGVYPQEKTVSGTKFVAFDSMKGIPVSERTELEKEEAAKNHGAYSRGRVGQQQLMLGRGLVADVETHGRVLVVHHHLTHPPVSGMELPEDEEPDAPHGLMGPLEDAEELRDWGAEQDINLVFHGHKHRFWPPYIRRRNILILNTGSSVHGKPKKRARIVDIWPDAERIDVADLGFI